MPSFFPIVASTAYIIQMSKCAAIFLTDVAELNVVYKAVLKRYSEEKEEKDLSINSPSVHS